MLLSGDYALKDDDGYLWLLGRADDVLKIAGHRIGTAELESCIVSNDDVAESAVCGIPDDIKGEVIIAFVVLKNGIITDKNILEKNLYAQIRNDIGAIASPKQIYFVYYVRDKDSERPETAWIMEGVGNGEKIGDFGLVGGGAAGLELDRNCSKSK